MPVAGWYDDGVTVGVVRWWDGVRWTGHTRAVAAGSVQGGGVPVAGSVKSAPGVGSWLGFESQPSREEGPSGVGLEGSSVAGRRVGDGAGDDVAGSGVSGGVRPRRRDRQRVREGGPSLEGSSVVSEESSVAGRRVGDDDDDVGAGSGVSGGVRPRRRDRQQVREGGGGGESAVEPVRESVVEPVPVSGPGERIGFFSGKRRALELQRELAQLWAWIDSRGLRGVVDASALEAEVLGKVEDAEVAAREHVEGAEVEAANIVERARGEAEALVEDARKGAAREARRLAGLRASRERVEGQIADAKSELVDVRAHVELQGLGVFDFEHPAESSVELAEELAQVRKDYKRLVREKKAIYVAKSLSFEGSVAKGARLLRQMSALMLRSYNAEAENVVKGARAGNLASSHKRLMAARDRAEKYGKMISLRIRGEYHRLRVRELELAVEYLQVREFERELERERRAQLREERRVEKELRAARAKLEKEVSHYENLLASLEARGDTEGAERARAELSELEVAVQDVEVRQANTRAGYVYVVSNVGSLGEGVVKIGMTRRLEPMDRIRELGGASVPFRYDVHALFFSADAVGVEAFLHRHFSAHRVNRVNLRREFFAVSPMDVREALAGMDVELVDFEVDVVPEEFLQSEALRDASPTDGVAA